MNILGFEKEVEGVFVSPEALSKGRGHPEKEGSTIKIEPEDHGSGWLILDDITSSFFISTRLKNTYKTGVKVLFTNDESVVFYLPNAKGYGLKRNNKVLSTQTGKEVTNYIEIPLKEVVENGIRL